MGNLIGYNYPSEVVVEAPEALHLCRKAQMELQIIIASEQAIIELLPEVVTYKDLCQQYHQSQSSSPVHYRLEKRLKAQELEARNAIRSVRKQYYPNRHARVLKLSHDLDPVCTTSTGRLGEVIRTAAKKIGYGNPYNEDLALTGQPLIEDMGLDIMIGILSEPVIHELTIPATKLTDAQWKVQVAELYSLFTKAKDKVRLARKNPSVPMKEATNQAYKRYKKAFLKLAKDPVRGPQLRAQQATWETQRDNRSN